MRAVSCKGLGEFPPPSGQGGDVKGKARSDVRASRVRDVTSPNPVTFAEFWYDSRVQGMGDVFKDWVVLRSRGRSVEVSHWVKEFDVSGKKARVGASHPVGS